MIYLHNSLKAWGTADFRTTLKNDLECLSVDQLPLQQGLSVSSYVADKPFTVIVLDATEQAEYILVKTTVLYSGVIAGCNCADDPTPVEEQNEHCELLFEIDKCSAATRISLAT